MEIESGRIVYGRLKVSGSDKWLIGRAISQSESGNVTLLLEIPRGVKVPGAVEASGKKGTVLVTVVKGPSSLVQLTTPSGAPTVPALSGAEALQCFNGLEAENFQSLSSEEDSMSKEEMYKELVRMRKMLGGDRGISGGAQASIIEDSEAEDDDDEDILRIARDMEQQWKTGKSSRTQKLGAQSSQPQSIPSAPASAEKLDAGTLQLFVMKEILEYVQQLKKKKAGDSDESSDEEKVKSGKVARSMRAYHDLKRQVRSKPKRLVREYLQEVKTELGVIEGMPFTLRDYGRKIVWSKHKTLQKVFEMMVATFEFLEAGEVDSAKAQLVQNIKAVHQTVLEEGDWRHSWLLTGLVDPGRPKAFGGSEREMEVVSAFAKDMEELKKKTRGDPRTVNAE